MKKTLLFTAKGFETIEFGVFVDVLGWARDKFDCGTQVVTCGFEKQVISTFGIPIIVDRLIDEIDADDYDALAIPGGFEQYGFYEEALDERFLNLIRAFDAKTKPIAAICVAALPLGKSGILKGRRATTYHLGGGTRQKQLATFGADVQNTRLVVDRNIVTSYCPETAFDVAFELLRMLTSNEKTNAVKEAMGFAVQPDR